MAKKKVVLSDEQRVDAALKKWDAVNDFLRSASEDEAALMLSRECVGLKRLQVLIRSHSRMNKQRAVRERTAIFEIAMRA